MDGDIRDSVVGIGYIRFLSGYSEDLIWHHRLIKELYTVIFIGIVFSKHTFKTGQGVKMSVNCMSSPLPQMELLRPS